MNRLWIGAGIALVLILIVGGLGWKARWLEINLNNARVGEKVQTNQGELKDQLNEDLDSYVEESGRRRDQVDQAIDRVRDAAAPRLGGTDGTLDRMRRADAAWRSGIVELCPECAPDRVGDPSGGEPEGLSGNEAAPGQ